MKKTSLYIYLSIFLIVIVVIAISVYAKRTPVSVNKTDEQASTTTDETPLTCIGTSGDETEGIEISGAIPVEWSATLTECTNDCHGALFTKLPPDNEEFPLFVGYYSSGAIPKQYLTPGQHLKIIGNWKMIYTDPALKTLKNRCVPIVEITEIR